MMKASSPTHQLIALTHRLVFVVDRRARELLSAESASFSDLLILHVAAHCGHAPQQKIAALLSLTAPAVSRRIDALVERKLVKREKSPDSRREVRIELTARGREELARMQEILERGVKRQFEKVSAKEIAQASRVITTLLEHFDDTK